MNPNSSFVRFSSGIRSRWVHSALFFVAIYLVPVYLSGQDLVVSSVHRKHVIESKVLGEQRTILVRVPINYDRTDERLPVVYMLDAHPPQNAMMVGMLEQARSIHCGTWRSRASACNNGMVASATMFFE